MNKTGIFLILSLLILSSCINSNRMTIEEKKIIEAGDTLTPMRVLVVDNEQDSIVLRRVSKNLDCKKDREIIQKLIQRLKVTMSVESGVGIAAPQVGISRNLFLFIRIGIPEHPVEVAINPEIISHSEKTLVFEGDGCLSVPGKSGNSVRYKWIEVKYINEFGVEIKEKLNFGLRNEDFTGVIFQHEFDHLNGILYTDKLNIE